MGCFASARERRRLNALILLNRSSFQEEPPKYVGRLSSKPRESVSCSGPRLTPARGPRIRRALILVNRLRAREALTKEDVRSIRPGHGLSPKLLDELIGRRAARGGTPLSWACVA